MKKIIGVIILCAVFVILGVLFFGQDSSSKKGHIYFNEGFTKAQVEKINKADKDAKLKYNTKYKAKGVFDLEGIDATYVRDVDGDTIVVKIGNKEEKVRFLMMDTPETVKTGTPIEPYGIQAKEFVKSKLSEGDSIKLVSGKNTTDKYGRYLAYVYYKSGDKWYNLNEELVANGLARVAYVYEKKNPLLKDLYNAQDSAKEQKLNIWSINGYVTDKGYDLNAVAN